MNMLEGICGKVAPGLCRLSMTGGIAVRSKAGYRTYDLKKKQLTNCDHFVLEAGEDFFFVLPSNRVRPGDIILSGGSPRCVMEVGEHTITALNYEDATVETLIPERHLFMGNTYLYGKIVSIFGTQGTKGKKGAGRLMKYMMMSSLLKGREGGNNSAVLPLIMGMGSDWTFMDNLFEEEDKEETEAGEEE